MTSQKKTSSKSPVQNGLPTPAIGIKAQDAAAIAATLNVLLANQHVLYHKMRNFHWNLVGASFVEVHEFIEKLYTQLAMDIDEVAERMQQLGHTAAGSMAEFLALATMKEAKGGKKLQYDAIKELVADNELCAKDLRNHIAAFEEKYDDPGTVDLFTRLLLGHEKSAWMLRRYLG